MKLKLAIEQERPESKFTILQQLPSVPIKIKTRVDCSSLKLRDRSGFLAWGSFSVEFAKISQCGEARCRTEGKMTNISSDKVHELTQSDKLQCLIVMELPELGIGRPKFIQ